MVYTVISDSIGTISQFTRKERIKLNHSGALTDYQKKLTIPWRYRMQADFDDIRFVTDSGVHIPYWIESKTDSSTADVWVKNDYANGDTYIGMYYGNSGLNSGSNGSDTFIQWHGAASSGYIDAVTVNPTNVICELRIKQSIESSRLLFGLSNLANRSDSWIGIRLYPASPDQKWLHSKKDGASTSISETYTQNTNYHRYKITNDGTTARGYDDGDEISTGITTNIPTENLALFFEEAIDHGVQDWAFVRKYTVVEPTYSIGAEQHQRRTPQFIN